MPCGSALQGKVGGLCAAKYSAVMPWLPKLPGFLCKQSTIIGWDNTP